MHQRIVLVLLLALVFSYIEYTKSEYILAVIVLINAVLMLFGLWVLPEAKGKVNKII